MVLLDGNVVNIKLKKLSIPRIDRIFKVTTYADVVMEEECGGGEQCGG